MIFEVMTRLCLVPESILLKSEGRCHHNVTVCHPGASLASCGSCHTAYYSRYEWLVTAVSTEREVKWYDHFILHLWCIPFDAWWLDEMAGYPRFCSSVSSPSHSNETFPRQKKHTDFRKAYQFQCFAEYYVGALDLYQFRLTEDGAQGGLVWTRWWTLANIKPGSFLALLSDSERKKTRGQIAQILKQQESHYLPPYSKGWPVLQVGKNSPVSYATQCPCSQESATGPSPTGQRQTYVFA